jgi:hypothetical protein
MIVNPVRCAARNRARAWSASCLVSGIRVWNIAIGRGFGLRIRRGM